MTVYDEVIQIMKDHPEYSELGIFAGYGEFDRDPIMKTHSGFSQECDLMTLEWDHRGKYRGQWQDDQIGEGRIFIGPDPTGRCFVSDLTEDQMRAASALR